MPELPEVETIRRGLEKKIVGQMIKSVEILNSKTFIGEPKLLDGKKVLKVWRKAKVLGVDLGSYQSSVISHQQKNGKKLKAEGCELLTLLFHLKMTGQLILGKKDQRFIGGHPSKDMFGELPNKSTRVIFTFEDGSKLYFNDQRKFGWVRLVQGSELGDQSFLKSLGPEPLEKGFIWQILKSDLLKHKSLSIKVALLDQKIVSGIGNIYACEACFNAGIDPKKRVRELTDEEFMGLHRGVLKALRDGIKYGGSSRSHFVNEEGKKGLFLDHAFVYNRDGQMCKVCGGEIKKVKLGGRGTFWCPKCQQ